MKEEDFAVQMSQLNTLEKNREQLRKKLKLADSEIVAVKEVLKKSRKRMTSGFKSTYCCLCGKYGERDRSQNNKLSVLWGLRGYTSFVATAHQECIDNLHENKKVIADFIQIPIRELSYNDFMGCLVCHSRIFHLLQVYIGHLFFRGVEEGHFTSFEYDKLQALYIDLENELRLTLKRASKFIRYGKIEDEIKYDPHNHYSFQLYIFDVNNLHNSAVNKYRGKFRVQVIKWIREKILPQSRYYALWFAGQQYAKNPVNDESNQWYIEEKMKGHKIADIDAPLAFTAGEFIQKNKKQISEVWLGSGDKDFELIGLKCRELRIPFHVIVADKATLSFELQQLAESVKQLYGGGA